MFPPSMIVVSRPWDVIVRLVEPLTAVTVPTTYTTAMLMSETGYPILTVSPTFTPLVLTTPQVPENPSTDRERIAV